MAIEELLTISYTPSISNFHHVYMYVICLYHYAITTCTRITAYYLHNIAITFIAAKTLLCARDYCLITSQY